MPCCITHPTFAPGAAGFFMMDNLDADPICALCPQPGANCTAPGATLSRLLLMPGYWRRSNTSIAVLACATHRRRDPASPTHPSRFDRTPPHPPGATRCPNAHRRDSSGCGGGTAACREGRGLSGVYCTQCPEKQARHPAAAVLLRAAPCSPCQPRPIAMFEATAHPLPSPPRSTWTRSEARAPLATTSNGAPRCPCCLPRSPSLSPRGASSPRRLRLPVPPSAR